MDYLLAFFVLALVISIAIFFRAFRRAHCPVCGKWLRLAQRSCPRCGTEFDR